MTAEIDEIRLPGFNITKHARDQFSARWPELSSSVRDATAHMYFELCDAWRSGRRAKRKPAWAKFVLRGKQENGCYLWSEGEDRCYVLAKGRRRESDRERHHETYVVLTVIPRQHEHEKAGWVKRHNQFERKAYSGARSNRRPRVED